MIRSHSRFEPSGPLPAIRSDQEGRATESGFVLVAVVMFVLALTILGLSLFSLSGYEAQFMSNSYRKTQSFYDAMSGIERTKYILAAGHSMLEVKSDYPDGVIYASATRRVGTANPDSIGAVSFWDTSAVRMRVVAERTGERTMIEAWYVPQSDHSLYRDLIATRGRIAVYHVPGDYERDNLWGCGSIRNPDHGDWLGAILGPPTYGGGDAPIPEVQDYISAWGSSSSGPPDRGSPGSYVFRFLSGSHRIFEGPSAHFAAEEPGFGLASRDTTLRLDGVNGTVVWILRSGAYFEQPVTVTGAPTNNLIIVAGKSTNPRFRGSDSTGVDPGLWFKGGISSARSETDLAPGPRLFLVSDGTVALDRLRGISHQNSVEFLSVFSNGVFLRGPRGGPGVNPGDPDYIRTYEISHCGNDDAILNPLYDAGLLPNTIRRTKSFALVPGSFQEITDSNPPY